MTDYRDVQNPGHNKPYDYSTMGNQKSPLTGILIALAVIAVVFLGLFMLGGTTSTDPTAPVTSEQVTPAPAPTTQPAAPATGD